MKKLFVGKLAPSTTESELNAFFGKYGPVISAKIVNDPFTGRCRGFGFVEIEDNSKAEEAIRMLNGKLLNDYEVVVNEARPKENSGKREGRRPDRGGFGRNNNSRGGGRGGRY